MRESWLAGVWLTKELAKIAAELLCEDNPYDVECLYHGQGSELHGAPSTAK
jgi:hypothetical protein